MFELVKIMIVIILDFWLLQLIFYYKKGADRDYEMSLERPKIRKEIEIATNHLKDYME